MSNQIGAKTINTIWRYIRDHWHGRHSLARAFWINFLGLRVCLFGAQEAVMTTLPPGPVEPVWLVMGLALVAHVGVFAWQAVGLFRAAEARVQGSGQMFVLWGAQAALILGAFWAMAYSLEAWYLTRPDRNDIPSQAELNRDRAARYSLTLSEDGATLYLDGSLELGITDAFEAFLTKHPTITEIHLASQGGNVFEARGLAKAIRQRGLGTTVETECASACTTVFIGGLPRKLAEGARLGFHQYRIEADYAVLHANPEREEERDAALFKTAGVADWFVAKMHDREASGMWYPDLAELLEAGVVTELATP